MTHPTSHIERNFLQGTSYERPTLLPGRACFLFSPQDLEHDAGVRNPIRFSAQVRHGGTSLCFSATVDGCEVNLAVGQNQRSHFGVGAPPF